jgi:hypothetical protein
MLVKESISFERGGDPKSILGIGYDNPRVFKSADEFIDFLIKVLPILFNGKIPDDIISRHGKGTINWNYYEKILEFLRNTNKTYIDYSGQISNEWRVSDYLWQDKLKRKLLDMGLKESISFERGGDPKSILGIGYDNIMHKKEILDALEYLIQKHNLKKSEIKIEQENDDVFQAQFSIEYKSKRVGDNYTMFYISYTSEKHEFMCGYYGEYVEDWDYYNTIQGCIRNLDARITYDIKYHS